MEKTYWNGEETPCRKVVVRVGSCELDTYWYRGLTGTERNAVEVVYAGDIDPDCPLCMDEYWQAKRVQRGEQEPGIVKKPTGDLFARVKAIEAADRDYRENVYAP